MDEDLINSITLTVYFDGSLWRGLLKRQTADGITIAKHTFGNEPTDPELLEFVLHEFDSLNFSDPQQLAEQVVQRARVNFKRMQREVKKAMKKTNVQKETLAQEVLRLNLESEAKEARKKQSRQQKIETKQKKFEQKQAKKKKKQKGH